MKTKKKPPPTWKRGDGWVQFIPSRNHPCYKEWQQKKERDEHDSSKDHR